VAIAANGETPFGFTPEWYDLGIVDEAVLARLQAEWDKGEDDNSEHYRNWAFREFFAQHDPLKPELAVALWELAESDPDLCWVIRTHIVQRPECPKSLEEAALASGVKHLVRIIEWRRRDSQDAESEG
jgi:hypothetical protein